MTILSRLWLIFLSWKNYKPEQITCAPKKPKRPTEIFPELALWRVGDEVKERYDSSSWIDSYEYKGVSDDGIIYLNQYPGNLKETSVLQLGHNYRNERIRKEKIKGVLSESEMMKEIARFQELIKGDGCNT